MTHIKRILAAFLLIIAMASVAGCGSPEIPDKAIWIGEDVTSTELMERVIEICGADEVIWWLINNGYLG